jgi:hypothetical protein
MTKQRMEYKEKGTERERNCRERKESINAILFVVYHSVVQQPKLRGVEETRKR